MRRAKQIGGFLMSAIMVTTCMASPLSALAAEPIAVETSTTTILGASGKFTDDQTFTTSVSNATEDTKFTATVDYKDTEKKDVKITSDTKPTKATQTTTTADQLNFTFSKDDINKLPKTASSYDVIVTCETDNTVNSKIGTIYVENQPIVEATTGSFNTKLPTDFSFSITSNQMEVADIKNGATTLTKDTDYIIGTDKKTIIIKKEYLSKFSVGQKLTFKFANADSQDWNINYISKEDNPVKTVILMGNQKIANTVSLKVGDKIPTWNKAKLKEAGKKGYEFTGWLQDGKIVTTIQDTDADTITLQAQFKKISVGQASALSLKGHAGLGCGFHATSKLYTKVDGSRRGFRFRYSSYSNMKSSIYKTTGLGKNTYTKIGLSKGKKRYVQVRYYYYDSTNTKVYGKYSKTKSVKTY